MLLVVLVGGYVEHWAWTGYRDAENDELRTLWDWLGVTVLPVTVALTPAWLRTRGSRRREWRLAICVFAASLGVLALGGYVRHWRWTGFTGNTLYDWLQLFLVPCALPVAFAVFQARISPRRVDGQDPERLSVSPPPGAGRSTGDVGTGGWLVGAAALLFVASVAALVGDRGGGDRASGRGASSAPAPSDAVARWVVVDGQDPWWTDTGIHVLAHQRVNVSATGQVRPSPRHDYDWVSPEGEPAAPSGHVSIDDDIPHAALVAMVGSSGRARRLGHGPTPAPIFYVGDHRTITVPRAGELFLGLNDGRTKDNEGWFGTTVTVHR
jgi:hypothetical protein